MKRLSVLLLFGLYVWTQSFLTLPLYNNVSLPPNVEKLSPQSLFHTKEAILKQYCLNIFESVQDKTSVYRSKSINVPFGHNPRIQIEENSFYVSKEHKTTQIEFRYLDVTAQKSFLYHGTISNEAPFQFGFHEYPLQNFFNIEEHIVIQFKNGHPPEDTGVTIRRDHPPRIGDHSLNIKAVLSDRNFMQETIDTIFNKSPYSRNYSAEEIQSIYVEEDDNGSQKQTYKVLLSLVDNTQLSFALKMGINVAKLGRFQEEEIKHLVLLRPSGTVPIMGAKISFEPLEIHEQTKKEYQATFEREKQQKWTQDNGYKIETYSEEFIYGTTLGQGKHYVRKEKHSDYIERCNDYLSANKDQKRQLYPRLIPFEDHLINKDKISEMVVTWIKAAQFLTTLDPDRQDKTKITFIQDMQPNNIMVRLLANKEDDKEDDKKLTKKMKSRGDSTKIFTPKKIIGNPVIIDVGHIAARQPVKELVIRLFKQYYSLVIRGPPLEVKDTVPVKSFLDSDSMDIFGEFIVDAFLKGCTNPETGVQWLTIALEDFKTEPLLEQTVKSSDTLTVQKLIEEKKMLPKEKTNFIWRLIAYQTLTKTLPKYQNAWSSKKKMSSPHLAMETSL